MNGYAFVEFASIPCRGGWGTLRLRSTCANPTKNTVCRRARQVYRIDMQLPPPSHQEPPLTEEEKGPPGYVWNDDFPGTLKPGTVEDNFPLEKVLASDVYNRMKYQELDIDEVEKHIFEPDEDLLQWLAEQGRLLPRNMSEDEFDSEAERQISGITEEDLDFADDDDKMIAYYSRQGAGSATGADADFGGFAEPSSDTYAAGF